MSSLLQLQAGSKFFGARKLFENASFAVNEGEHVGVIGPNGAGKTTLFKILINEIDLDEGELIKSKRLKIGYLSQHDQWPPGQTIADYLSSCALPLWELKRLAKGLGLDERTFEKQTLDGLSGGYRMRCKLLYLIGQEPNLMLLDEPTNYLDLETTLVLENFLQGYNGAFLLISHDREFLRRTTDHILEVEQGDITKFNGHIDDYFEQKALLREQLESRALALAEKRAEILSFVSRFGAKATKARQAQSRLKALHKMESIELKPLSVGANIRIPPPIKAGKSIVTICNADFGYKLQNEMERNAASSEGSSKGNTNNEIVVLKNVNFTLQNGDHLAVVGLNGAGKSTFLKSLVQLLPPIQGEVELGYQVSIGYYAQHVAESLPSHQTVLEAMTSQAHPDVSLQEALNLAGSLLFSGSDVHKKISVLSGGEKSRVALGQILLKKSPCLVLDEPTNHLDFQTVEALTQALIDYKGTVVVVSHDRSFIRRIGTKIIEIRQGQVFAYPGTYDEYVWSLGQSMLNAEEVSDPGKVSKATSSSPSLPSSSGVASGTGAGAGAQARARQIEYKQAQKRIAQIEKEMQQHQARLDELNMSIQNSQDHKEQTRLIMELSDKQNQMAKLEEEWLELSERI